VIQALHLVELVRPVADLARSRAFYTEALGFVEVESPAALHPLLAEAWGGAPSGLLRLRLGAQTLLLARCDATPAQPDDGADDPLFQHIAIVTRDIAGAWQRLLAHGPLRTISREGPQRLPERSGGVTAVKFRDPDGHPLELLAFAPGALPRRWAAAGDGLTLGIDHSAVTVTDADRSIDFYRRELGLERRSRQCNQGPEQAGLDGLVGPVVDVVSLAPAAPSPHLELLGYRFPRVARRPAGGPRATTIWQGDGDARLLTDPDHHRHLLLAHDRPPASATPPPSPAEAPIPSDEDPWLLWGPYLSERQWGTVREDTRADGNAWASVTHDMARSYAYRWGEEGIAGLSDERQRLCLSLALWNGRDAILKERLFGLSNAEGNHGEDVKEVYHYLDNLPDHRYMRMLYRYPQAAFPYDTLVAENAARSREDPEYELADTGIFEDQAFFDVFVEIAKPRPTELLVRYTVHNRGDAAAALHLLPTLWLRKDPDCPHGEPPSLHGDGSGVLATHPTLGRYRWTVEGCEVAGDEGATYLFTDNATNAARIESLGGRPSGTPVANGFFKDGIDNRVVRGWRDSVRSEPLGTKAAGWRSFEVAAGGSATLRLRLSADGSALPPTPFGDAFDAAIALGRADADAFYAARQDASRDAHCLAMQRQAWAGLLWNKQFYAYEVRRWLDGDAGDPPLPAERLQGRNTDWPHLRAHDVILMPDKWEYPWFAAWDLAFQCIALAPIDPEFAKGQLLLLLHDRYMHPNGQLPAYEWNLGDVNPPVHALAAWKVYQRDAAITGKPDTAFLRRVLHRLMLNFTWWVNRQDRSGNNIFEGGFLGLDNIGVFDRSQPIPDSVGGGELEQADGTSWMAMYALNLMRIAMELAQDDPVYEDLAIKFAEHFFHIAGAMTNMGNVEGQGLWDEEDGFYYDMLRLPDGSSRRLRLRTIAGLVPFFAVEVLDEARLGKLQRLQRHLDNFLHGRPDLDALVSHWREPSRDTTVAVGDDPAAPRATGSFAETDPARRSHLFSLLRGHRMKRVLHRLLDETEFLSPYGVRSVSKAYEARAFDLTLGEAHFDLHYTPAESDSDMFGGNSNWRGPVWLPMNYLIVESLRRFHAYYGDDFQVECPTGSGQMRSIAGVADFLQQRLLLLYRPGLPGKAMPGNGKPGEAADRDLPPGAAPLLFHEYFHGDTGQGLGASHQTGWTALLALF